MTPVIAKSRRDFASDEQGSIAILFGLMFMALAFIVGMAVDYTRVTYAQSRIAAAADTAALAAGKAMLDNRMTDDDIRQLANAFFDENVGSVKSIADIHGIDVALDRANGGVTINVDAEVPMTITRIGNFQEMDVPVLSSTAFEERDIELGMALDTTGSMAGSKIEDLKTAAKDLVDILIPEGGSTNKVRIGLAPYAASVRAGAYAGLVSGGTSTDGCVRERTGAERYTDAAPGPGTYFTAGGSPRDIDSTEGNQGYDCPSAGILPLTTSKADLKRVINSFRASGSTAGHIGTAWAWNLISPEWRTVWPAASRPVNYGTARTLKALVLMTDGIFNVAYVNGKSSTQAVSLCDSMKDKGVVVYTIGFKAPAGAAATLKSCASTPDHYFNAEDGEDLRRAFISIAGELNTLRLTQ